MAIWDPQTQLQPFYGHRVPARRLPKGALTLAPEKDAPPNQNARTSDKNTGGHNLWQVAEFHAKAGKTRRKPQLMDLEGGVEAHK